MLDITKDIHSLTAFRRRSGQLLKHLHKSKRPVVLTVRGQAAAVVQDAEDMRLELLELVTLKYRSTGSHHPGLELADRKRLRLGGKPGHET